MKRLAIAKLTDPTVVAARAAAAGGLADAGAIYVTIPELGFKITDMIYCRYGLSIPYMRVQVNDKLWVEPSIDGDERWIYTGFADCAGRVATTPTSADQMILDTFLQTIYVTTIGTMHLSSKTALQPFVKGLIAFTEMTKHQVAITALQTALATWVPVPTDGGAALKTALAAFLALPMPNYATILSTKLFGE